MPRRVCAALLAGASLLLVAPAARAGWFPSEAIDGPADVVSLGGVDIGRDGAGGVAYLKRDGGVAHVFVSRLLDGVWQAPERVDAGIAAPATAVAIAAGDDRRLIIGWVAGNQVFGSFAAGGTPGPLSAPQPLAAAGGPPTSIDADMGVNGTGYVTWAAPGAGGSDVGAARLLGSTWETVPAALDLDPAGGAGAGAGRPRVAVAADGNAVVTWGEAGSVVARRVTGLSLSLAPQIVSVPSLNGGAGGLADSPDIDVEDDGSFAWVVFRQDIGGSSLAIARRLIGSQFEPPAVVGGPGATAPAIAMDERGAGQSVVANADGTIMGSQLDHDAFAPPAPLGGGDGPQVATSERQDMAAAWHVGPGQVTGLYRHEKALGPPTLLSTAGFGVVPAGQLQIGGDRLGDMVVAMLQGDAGARHVTAAVYDRPPGRPLIYRSSGIQKRERPVLRFRPALDLWGAPTYELMIGRRLIAASQTATKVRAAASVSQGRHRVRLVQVDRRGQTGVSRPRIIRVDGTPPRLRVKVRGKRRRGAILRITVRASDGQGTGLRYVEINFGDRTRRVRAKRALHRYRAGSFTLTVKAVDKIGNVALRKVKLRIKK